MECLQPTRIAVERANGYHVFVQSHGRSLRAVALAGERWSSSMVMSLCWRSAIVGLSQSLMQASSSRGLLSGEPWSTVHMEQRVFGESCLFRSDWSLRWLDSASVRMHRRRASHSRFVKDCASWRRKLVESPSRHGSREVPGPSVPGRVRSVPSRQMSVVNVHVRTRM